MAVESDGVTEVTAAPAPVPLRHNRDFTLLWTGQAMSLLGNQISAIAYPLLILAVTGSAAQAGIMASVTLVSTLALLLPAGVVADRYPRKRIMVTASLIQMAAGATVVPAILTHHVYLIHLAVVGCIQGAAGAFYLGASRGATRRIVPLGQLPQAMSTTSARDRITTLAGGPAGGALFSVARSLPFAADSVSFGAIALASALIRKPLDPVKVPDREPLRQSVTKGIRFVFQQPFVRMFAIWTTALNGIVFGLRLTIIVLARNRGATPFDIGLLFAITAVCGLPGAMVAVRLTKMLGGRLLVLITSWLFVICTLGMYFAPSVWYIAVLAGVTGFAIIPVNVVLISRSYQLIPDHLQAQAGNALQLCYQGLGSLSPAIYGVLTDKAGPYALIAASTVLFALLAIWLQFNPQLGQVDEPLGGDEVTS
jgi:MFS family permease